MTGNPAEQASAFFAKHRTAVLAGGGAGVVGLAMLTRSRRKAAAASDPSVAGTAATTSQVGQPADPYSTVAYDVYDALQPQLEQGIGNLQSQIDALNDAKKAPGKKKPHPKPKTLPYKHKVPRKSPRKPILKKRTKKVPAVFDPHPPTRPRQKR